VKTIQIRIFEMEYSIAIPTFEPSGISALWNTGVSLSDTDYEDLTDR